jgi:hypothetical protein
VGDVDARLGQGPAINRPNHTPADDENFQQTVSATSAGVSTGTANWRSILSRYTGPEL